MNKNPNTPEFFNKLFNGTFDLCGVSRPYIYEAESRKAAYKELIKMPFFNFSGKILDVGCGMGGVLSLISKDEPIEKFGIDFSAVGIKKCIQRMDGCFCIGDIHNIPYEDNFFDRVICIQTLEHIDNVEQVVSEIWRVLKVNGMALITVPYKPHGRDTLRLHINRFSTKNLSKLFELKYSIKSIYVINNAIRLIVSKNK